MPQPVTVTFLGGLSDIGRNCAVLESGGSGMILDCGTLFPNELQPGVELILPDLDYLLRTKSSIDGCLITHAHEDHIGGIRFLVEKIKCPIYGSAFSLNLIERRLAEWGLAPEFIEVEAGESQKIGPFECEFLNVTHSVPGGHITAIKTPQGVILHSSDFKLDEAPIDGTLTDLQRIEEISKSPGVRLLLADSTNSDQMGASESESSVEKALVETFSEQEGRRIFVSCFSSHLHRVQQIVNAAQKCGRQVAVMGMSMRGNVDLGIRLGILDMDGYVDIAKARHIDDSELCIITPGSQAEPGSSLASAVEGKNRWVKIGDNDAVVLSADPIPGNEARVYRMINSILRSGAKVAFGSRLGLHTTGHGKSAELKVLHEAARSEWFTPVHGEYRHLLAHKSLAVSLGMAEDKVLLAVDGDQIEMGDKNLKLNREVTPGTYLMGQGKLVGQDQKFLKERLELSRDGVISLSADIHKNKLVGEVSVSSRGWLGDETRHKSENRVQKVATDALKKALKSGAGKPSKTADKTQKMIEVQKLVRKAAREEITRSTGRYPAILLHLLDG